MKRRQALFGILGLGMGVASVRSASAQRPSSKLRVIGLLDTSERSDHWAAFRQQMRELGYVENRDIAFEPRFAGGNPERVPAFAKELVRLNVAVIVTGGNEAALEAKRATASIPIVMATGVDQVSSGLVVSLARPGRNVTGLTSLATDLTAKRLDLLRELFPKMTRLAVLWRTDSVGSMTGMRDLEAAARTSKMALLNVGIAGATDLAEAFATATREHAEAVYCIHSGLMFPERRMIAELALKHRLPTVHGPSEYVDAGGLMSYGPHYPDLFRRAAFYVDKILKGAKPAKMPVEQPTKFEMVVNQQTAKALGISIPQTVLIRADRVIE